MSSLLKPWLRRSAGISISILFLYLAVRKVDLSESFRALGQVLPALLVCAALVYLAGYPVRALRWRRILRTQRKLSFRQTLVPVFVGYMANNLLPARAGEVYRAHFLGRRARMSRSGAAASIVVERAFDGLALVVVTLLISLLFPREHFLGVAAFLTGLIFLRLEAGGYTVVIWVLEASAMTLAVLSFGIALPLAGFLLIYGLAALGTTLPSGPGYVGPYQYAFVLSLGVFEVSRETALAVSIATQIALLGSVTVIGLALLWREHLRPAPERKEETG